MQRGFKVLLHIDEFQRDFLPLHWIGYFLEKMGAKVRYCTRYNRYQLWRHWKPHAFLDSHLNYHKSEEILRDMTKNSLLFVLPAEGLQFNEEHVHIPYTGVKNDKTSYLKYVTRVFLWGKWQNSLLYKKKLFPEGLSFVSGNPKFDGIKSYKRKLLHKRTVGIVGLFNAINIFDNRNFLSLIYGLRNRQGINFNKDGEVEDFVWYQVGAFRIFMTIAEMLIRRGYTVSFRPHQLENSQNYKPFRKIFGSRFVIDNGGDFQSWLSGQHAVIVMKTTSIYEAFSMGVPIITVEELFKDLDSHMKITNYRIPELLYCWRPKSFLEAVSLIDQAAEEKLNVCPEIDKFREKIKMYFDFPGERSSSWFIADTIYKECQKKFGKSLNSHRLNILDMFFLLPRWFDFRYYKYKKRHNLERTARKIWKDYIENWHGDEK